MFLPVNHQRVKEDLQDLLYPKTITLSRANSSYSIADAIDALVNDTSFDVQKIKDDNYNLPSILALIEKQKVIIKDLSSKVSFLLSYLGLQESPDIQEGVSGQPASVTGSHPVDGWTATSANNPIIKRSFADMVTSSLLSNKTKPNSTNTLSTTDSSADSSKKIDHRKPEHTSAAPDMKLNKILRGAVLTAVHADMMARETRRKNIIISGLPFAHGISDTALVDDLIESEFGSRPLIARTRRLGRPIDGHIQPIAVTLSVINDAIYLVDNAKMLRKFANDNVRNLSI